MEIDFGDGMVTGVAYGEGPVGVLLAHGAGAGQDHPWMTTMARRLADNDLAVLTFNYRYTERGRKSPDRLPVSLAVHRAAAGALSGRCDRVVLAGKSMGGRVGSHLAGDEGWPAAAMVYFGYPLVAVGKTEPRPTDHLERIEAPQLFVTGSRDRFGPIDMITAVVQRIPNATLIEVEGGDHSFKVPKASGTTLEDVITGVAIDTAAWIDATVDPYQSSSE